MRTVLLVMVLLFSACSSEEPSDQGLPDQAWPVNVTSVSGECDAPVYFFLDPNRLAQESARVILADGKYFVTFWEPHLTGLHGDQELIYIVAHGMELQPGWRIASFLFKAEDLKGRLQAYSDTGEWCTVMFTTEPPTSWTLR